ncbi:MAG: hypothetical protein AAFW81_12820 [Pseudomonadota bacterium]
MIEATPRLIDFILAGIVLEAVAIAYLLSKTRALELMAPALAFLASGALLMLALRAALAGAPGAIPAFLLGSFAAHVAALIWAGKRYLRSRDRDDR